MIRLTQAIVAVMACTVASGVAGGIVGLAVGTFAPSFVHWLQDLPPKGAPQFDPAEFGLGLGIVSGLFFGAAVGSFLVAVIALRDAWLARGGLTPEKLRAEREMGGECSVAGGQWSANANAKTSAFLSPAFPDH